MFKRLVAALLVVAITACSSFPPRTPAGTQEQGAAEVVQQPADTSAETREGTTETMEKVFIGFLIVAFVIVIAAFVKLKNDGIKINLNK